MYLAISFIVGVVGIFYLLKSYFRNKKDVWVKQGVTLLESDVSAFQLLTGKKYPADVDQDNYNTLKKNNQKFGGVVELGVPLLLVRDLDVVKHILVKDFDHFIDRRDFIDTDPMLSKALFFLHSQQWKDIRNILSPTFTSGKIKRMFHNFGLSKDKLLEFIQKEHPKSEGGFEVNVSDIMSRFTMDVIGAVAFGLESGVLTKDGKNSEFYAMARKVGEIDTIRAIKMGLFSFFPKVGNFFKMEGLESNVSNYFTQILRSTLRQRREGKEKREDFLQLLIEAEKSDDKNMLTEDIVIPQAFLFFMAGFHTTANLLGEALYQLALNPEIQDKLYNEVEMLMEECNGTISYEGASQAEYLEMVLSEILRMYPPVERLERKCTKEYKIPETGIIIPINTVIGIPANAIHYDEDHYENPNEFNPERFSNENKSNRNPYAYLPFGQGPRNCIGMRLALIESKVALASLVYNFNVQPISGKTPIPVQLKKIFGTHSVPTDLELRMVPRNH